MNATENTQETTSNLAGIKTLCRVLKIMFWLYLGCLIYLFPSGYPFVHNTTFGIRVFYPTYIQFFTMPGYGLLLYAVGGGLFIWAALTFHQLLGLYEQGKIFTEANVRLLRRLGWLAVSYGLLAIVLQMLFDGLPSFDPVTGARMHRNIMELLARGFFAGLSCSPWVMGGVFLTTISHVMLQGYKLQEEQELTV